VTAVVPARPGAAAGDVAPAPRDGLRAAAALTVDRVAGRPRIRWTHAWPVVLRPTGPGQVHLVHGAGGPLGGDLLSLDIRVGESASLAVRSAGATMVQPGRGGGPARWDTTVAVGAGGRLDWAPEPTVVTDGAEFVTSLRITLDARATVLAREIVVLGRHGRAGGSYRGHLAVTVDGQPLLAHTTVLDGADPALTGPAGTAGARAVGTLVLAGTVAHPGGAGERPRVRWAWSELDGPGAVLLAVGDPGAVTAVLDEAAPAIAQPGMIQP
jgi:urease accessory protein